MIEAATFEVRRGDVLWPVKDLWSAIIVPDSKIRQSHLEEELCLLGRPSIIVDPVGVARIVQLLHSRSRR